MPIELSDLIAKRNRTVKVRIADDEWLSIQWSPERMSSRVWADLQQWVKERGNEAVSPIEMAEKIAVPLMTGWDITHNGEPFPITTETVTGLGLPLCMAIASAIQADFAAVTDQSDTKKGSAATSLTIVRPEPNAPTGTSV